MFKFNNKCRVYVVFLSLSLNISQVSASPDYPREQRWANEVVPGVIVGEPVYLQQKNKHKFLALYAQAENSKMGVIVVHGMGLHPDWGMIGTIRQSLFDYGYTTLSIQMPILAADASFKAYPALFPDAVERLQISVNYLIQQGYKQIVIVSHSNGSRMSRVYMITNPANVTAWVALSLTQGDTFAGVSVPVFDLYGENDLPHVLSSTRQRRASFSGTTISQQMVIPGADHFFSGHEQEMVNAVKRFLDGFRNQYVRVYNDTYCE